MTARERLDKLLAEADERQARQHERTEAFDSIMREAQLFATLALVDQQVIANKLRVALVDQLSDLAKTQAGPGYPVDPSIHIRDYLTAGEWKVLDL